ncbi:sirohydrochlorin chelatase [Streptomyces sp. H10-C2]|uniref:sirohydrochlorin chelatase n=1 Tax=unclassified Streptomyces TaxID=2593676 RepID=UPI0024B9584E|nr:MULTISPECIES: sirohydrochlorin chelatase [unclassified Streptomyces]MDJ0344650.1 sirohydrochlorin chelatase [Streptomyces sp. PH10-H1]MDJ0373190.1 sirohydrochlorin chelatase [Streptomyces sp. H10-C2]
MTASTAHPKPHPEHGPAPADTFGSFDSTAQLLNRITAQLSSQLSHVTLTSVPREARERREPNERREPRKPRESRAPHAPALVAVAHGSRDPGALRTVRALLDRVRALRPDLPVHLGHIELNEPLLDDTLAALRGDVVLVPLLLGRGYHVKQDLPQALARAPHLRGLTAAPLGPHPLLAEALHVRLAEAGWRKGVRRAGVVLAAAGSRDPDAAADTAHTAELLSRRLGGVPVLPGYASGVGPSVAEAVGALTARGHRVAVASYFTAPGRFAAQASAAAPWIAAAPLGAHSAMARLVLHRYDQALAAPTLAAPFHLASA